MENDAELRPSPLFCDIPKISIGDLDLPVSRPTPSSFSDLPRSKRSTTASPHNGTARKRAGAPPYSHFRPRVPFRHLQSFVLEPIVWNRLCRD